MSRLRLSPHFTVEEFDCHNGARVPSSCIPALRSLCVHVLEPLRSEFGAVRVVSGYRERLYNRSIGSTDGSYHVYDLRRRASPSGWGPGGVAADLVPATGRPETWAAWARQHRTSNATLARRNAGGVGRYLRSGFVHLDTGPRRDWEG